MNFKVDIKSRRSTGHFKVDVRTIPYLTAQKFKVISSSFDTNASQACWVRNTEIYLKEETVK